MDHDTSLSLLVAALGLTLIVLLFWRVILVILATLVVGLFAFGILETAVLLRN